MKALFTHSFLSLKLMSFGLIKITIFFKLELRHILQHLPMASCNTFSNKYLYLKEAIISASNKYLYL